MNRSRTALSAIALSIVCTCWEKVHAKPHEYQILACQNLLRSILARPGKLTIGKTEIISQDTEANDKGSAIIYFTAEDKYAKKVDSRAFCSMSRASASIMDIYHVDLMKDY